MTNPSYVRIAKPNQTTLRVDTVTGWSISGWDVKEFPSDPTAANFVRRDLNRQILEEASQDEFKVAHPDPEPETEAEAWVRAVKAAGVRPTVQEAHVQARVREGHAQVVSARQTQTDEGGNTATMTRRQQTVDVQNKAGLGTDDPEKQVEGSSTGDTATKVRKAEEETTKAKKRDS